MLLIYSSNTVFNLWIYSENMLILSKVYIRLFVVINNGGEMKKKIISMVLSLVMVATTLVGCGNKTNNEDSNNSETKTEENAKTEENKKDDYVVQIPISTSLCSAPMQLAKINGYFDEVGLNWEEVNLGDNSSLDFVATGKADISYDLLQTLVQRIASGLDYRVITGVHYGCINIVASKESGITEVSQLKGKRIGLSLIHI